MKQFLKITSGIVSLAVIIACVYGILHRQDLLDSLALRNYQPPARISAIADDTTMAPETRKVFYVNHPELNTKEDFRGKCPNTERSIVLGCYIERDGIFLLDVTEEKLQGIVEVTAAHEVLHAQYDRLNKGERKRIDALTAEFYNSISDERIKKTVEQYRAKDPSVVPNELHSILATEIRVLTPELENYYSKYFNDRSKIVERSEKYEQTFVELTSQVEMFDEQLKNLKVDIESSQQEIQALSADIDSQKNRLDSMINSGRTEDYNEAVPAYNRLVNEYNALINSTRRMISEYNDIVEKRNEIATTEQALVEAINSNIIPKETE